MENKEFNLRKKIIGVHIGDAVRLLEEKRGLEEEDTDWWIRWRNVKEFIRRLKEEIKDE